MKKTILFSLLLLTCLCLFSACGAENKETSGLEYKLVNGEVIIKSYEDSTARRKLVIPDEIDGNPVTKIDKFGVANAESLLEIHIGKNVKEIDDWGIVNNGNLFKFTVDPDNEYFCAVDGVLFNKQRTKLISYPERNQDPYDESFLDLSVNKSIPSAPEVTDEVDLIYVVPEGVQELTPHSFYCVDRLEKLVLPDSLKRIGNMALFQMYGLKEINFPEDLESIGKDSVAFCTSLTEIELPSTIRKLEKYAFFDCNKVTKVTVKAKQSDVEQGELWYPSDNGKELDELQIIWQNG